jgi:hypothetical protein
MLVLVWACAVSRADRAQTSFPNLYSFGLRHAHKRQSYEIDDTDTAGYENSSEDSHTGTGHSSSANRKRYQARDTASDNRRHHTDYDGEEEQEGGNEASYDVSILTPPKYPWENDFRAFTADTNNFEITGAYMQNGVIPEVDGDTWDAVYDTLYVVDGTNDLAANNFRARFTSLAGADHVCNITEVDPQLDQCVESWVQYRMNRFGWSEDEARRHLKVVMGGHGYGQLGGRISLGGGNWTVHPNKNLGDQEGAMFSFLTNQTKIGNEYDSIKILACDTGAGATDPNYAGVQKALAMLPGMPAVKAYNGTVYSSPNGTTISPSHQEITVQLKQDLAFETNLADINLDFKSDLAVY